MRLFLIRLFQFIIILLTLSFVLDFFVSAGLSQSNTFASRETSIWDDIYESRINSEILIYGSSRASVQIDPSIISDNFKNSAYNLGINGHDFWLQYLRHKEYLEYNSKPKSIILSVDIFTLSRTVNPYNLEQFYPFIFKNNIREFTKPYDRFSMFDYYLPLVRYVGKPDVIREATYAIQNKDLVDETNGYRGVDREWNADFKNIKNEIENYNVSIDIELVNLFKKFLKECSENKIDVVLIYSPEYIDGQRFISNREDVIELFVEISADNNMFFLNYANHDICFKKEYYYNALHFNKNGAEHFTRILVKDLNKLNFNK